MIESTFKLQALVGVITSLVLLIFLTSGLLIFMLTSDDNTSIFLLPAFLLLLFISAWLTWGEMRTKAIKVIMEPGKVTVKCFFGLGALKTIFLSDIDGYKISTLPSEYKEYEYLYLVTGKHKRIKISQFYHKNYFELKKEITKRCKNLGVEKFSVVRELKEIFR